MEKQLGWACKLGGTVSLRISKVSETVSARLMESQIWHQLAGSLRGGYRKGTMSSARLDARHFSSSLYATGTFQAATLQCWSSEGVSLSRRNLCVCSLRGNVWGSRSFLHRLNPCCLLQPEVVGTYLPGTGTLSWRAWSGAGIPHSQDIPPKFLFTTHG